MTPQQIEETFRDWWADSFPTAPPNSRTVESHAAFGAYLLELADTLREYSLYDR